MANQNLKGLAWGHRRATGPLEPLSAAFRRDHPDVSVEWSVRPLSDFEHQPIASIADRFDLMIIDHPFCGDIAASGACLPLEEAISELSSHADRLLCWPLAGKLSLRRSCVGCAHRRRNPTLSPSGRPIGKGGGTRSGELGGDCPIGQAAPRRRTLDRDAGDFAPRFRDRRQA